MWNKDDRIIDVIWEYQENLPAQGQHDKSLKSYPSLPAQLDSHSDTQSGLETVLDLWVPSHLLVLASFWVLQWSEAEQHTSNFGSMSLCADFNDRKETDAGWV